MQELDRLNKTLELIGIDERRLNILTGVHHGKIRKILSGDEGLDIDFINSIIEHLPISKSYIYAGEGEPLTGDFNVEAFFKTKKKASRAKAGVGISAEVCGRCVELRKLSKLSQEKWSEKLDITRDTWASIEGYKQNPTIHHLKKMNEVFNININWVISNAGQPYLEEEKALKKKVQYLETLNQKLLADILALQEQKTSS